MSRALEQARREGRLERHAPTLVYHPAEPYWASSAAMMTDLYVEDRYATYLQRSTGELLAQAGPARGRRPLTLGLLSATTYGDGGPDVLGTDYLNAHAGTWAQDARRLQADPAYRDKVYARYAQTGTGRVWLQYWFFYLFNDKSLAGIGLHEGDWEMIQVGLGDDGEPAVATYSQHYHAERRNDWEDVRRDGDSPIVFVALGSHASYFDPAEYRMPVPGMFDHARGGGRTARPAVVEVTGAEPWLQWPGRWGRHGLSDKASPQGPVQHDRQWNRPDEFHAKARKKRPHIGPIVLATEAEAPVPEVRAVRSGDEVWIGYDLRALRDAEDPVVRLLVAIDPADEHVAPATASLLVAGERGRVRHPDRVAPGDHAVHVTALTAQDRERASLTVPLLSDKPDREAFALRLLVELPEGFAGGVRALRAAATAALGVDADRAPWTVTPLFGPRPAGALARHYAVTGRAIVSPALPPQQQAFELAHQLAVATGATVVPDLPSSAFAAPEPDGDAGAFGGGGHDDALPPHWALTAVRGQEAWELEPTRGEGILIGHPDTGFTDHQELEGGCLALDLAWDVIEGDRDAHDPLPARELLWPFDSPGHGTGTASTIISGDSHEVTGVAPGARLVPFRAVKSVVQVFDGDVALAVEHARRAGCDVISMSLGGVGFAPAMRDAIRLAVESGVIVMAAAGNIVQFVTAPARWPECIAVGATRHDSKPWLGSSHGREVDFCAPGKDVRAATARRDHHGVPHFDVTPHTGTSFAVAHAAGAAALWLRHHGAQALRRAYGRSNVQALFVTQVRATARRPADWDTREYGAGILDIRALLEAPLPDPAAFTTGTLVATPAPEPDPLASLFPELSRRQLRAALDRALGARGKALDELLERHGAELLYQFSEDPELRAAVAPPAGALTVAPAGADARTTLLRTSSRALAARIG